MIKIKLNQDLRTPKGLQKKDDIISLETDQNKIPLDHFWRNRLKDSMIDNCVELVQEKESSNKKLKNNGKYLSVSNG